MSRPFTNKPTALYRFYGSAGELLYVGISVNPLTRWRIHAREKSWWHQVARHHVEWHPDRPHAEAAEVTAVKDEGPRYNVSHSTTRVRGDALDEYRSPYTKPRQIRIATAIWRDFGRAARAAGTTRGHLFGQFMRWYMRRPGARLPERPPVGAWSEPPAGD